MRIVARSPKYEALPTILSRRYSKSFLAGKISRLTAVLLLFKILGWSQSMRLASMIGSKCTAVSKYASRTPGPDERRPTRSGSPNQSEAEMRVHRILPCVASTVMSAFIIHGDHTATEGPGYLLETGDPFGSVHSINVMIQNNGLLGGTSFDYHQDDHALDQPNPECLGYTHIAALYVDSRVCCS